jgi:hypothetical protein
VTAPTPATPAGRQLVTDLEALEPPARWLDIGGMLVGRDEWATWLRALRVMVRSGVILAELEAARAGGRNPGLDEALNRGDGSYRP